MYGHLLPALHSIDHATCDVYKKHGSQITVLLNDFLLKYLNSLYAEFNGDLSMAIVLGEIAHHNISARLHKGSPDPALVACFRELQPGQDLLLPCNPFSISQATGIPRETVRRKFEELVGQGLIERVSPRGYVITPGVVQRFSSDFNVRLFEEFRLLSSRLSELFAEGASSP